MADDLTTRGGTPRGAVTVVKADFQVTTSTKTGSNILPLSTAETLAVGAEVYIVTLGDRREIAITPVAMLRSLSDIGCQAAQGGPLAGR